MMRRWIAGLLTAVLLLSVSGCSFVNPDVEKKLRAPHAQGEQSEIQTALEQHIYSRNAEEEINGGVVSYVLKYPKMGDYRSAFILKDMDADGKEEAIAFYALQPEGANSHIALLRKADGQWQCVDDIEGLATEIERIHFGDLDGNGRPELIAGFSMYNTRDRRLMLYMMEEGHLQERYSDTYTHMLVGHMTDSGNDDLVLFRLNSTDKSTTARLLTMENSAIVEKGTVALDSYILQFHKYAFADFGDGVRGVYQDCTKDSQTTITELILWDGNMLTAPLYDPVDKITTASARESGLPFFDINGDKQVEWPTSTRLPGDELTLTEDMKLWLSEWYAWDAVLGRAQKVHTNIVNPYDGYQITIPEEWIGTVTASYNEEQHLLSVKRVADGQIGEELFAVVAFPVKEKNPLGDDFMFLKLSDTMRYELRFNKDADKDLSANTIHNLISLCEIE